MLYCDTVMLHLNSEHIIDFIMKRFYLFYIFIQSYQSYLLLYNIVCYKLMTKFNGYCSFFFVIR